MKETAKIYGKEMTYNEAFKVYMKEKIKDKLYSYSKNKDKELVEIVNIFLATLDNEQEFSYCNENEVMKIFDNELYQYFENLNNSSNFDMYNDFMYKKDGWWNTTNDLDDVFNEAELTNYIYDNQGEFEEYLDFDEMVIEVEDDLKYDFETEDEEEE